MAHEPEKRKDKRGPAAFTVTYRVLEPMEARARFGEAERDGIAEDLSVGGLSLSGNHPIPSGAVVSVKFRATRQGATHSESGSRKFELRGQVRYCRPAGEPNSYRSGILFGKLSEDERRFIAELV
jgi:hypothetical protein